MVTFILLQGIYMAILLLSSYVTGLLVQNNKLKVNYSRKINHFVLFFFPVFFSIFIEYSNTLWSQIAGLVLSLLFLAVLSKPFRERFKVINTMFASFDRPEDRPHTLTWLSSQIIVGDIILIILGYFFAYIGKPELVLAPVLINGIGDGLAEPIGVKFGKHKYRTKGFFTDQYYVRSIEGSLCVYVVSIITIILLSDYFSLLQLILAVIIVPVTLTLAEAWAPHTWDTPFLFFTAGLVLGGICILHI